MSTLDLYRHMEWADAEVWRAVLATPAALQDERLMVLLTHLHDVQRSFHLMWTAPGERTRKTERTPQELLAYARELYPELDAFVVRADDALRAQTMHMPWLSYFEKRLGRSLQQPTVGETLIQLPMHSTYHRGQINLRLRELGGEPPLVDYIAWVWFGRPAADWG